MLAETQYVRPETPAEASDFLAHNQNALVLAGGTDVLVGIEGGKLSPSVLVDIGGLEELKGIREEAGRVWIGALTFMSALRRSELVHDYFPALVTAASSMGCWQVQNRATLGGNLCNASPSADTAPPLLVYGAVAVCSDGESERRIPVESFLAGPGKTDLLLGELLLGVEIEKPAPDVASAYARRSLRRSMDIPVVNVAVSGRFDDVGMADPRVALGAVGPVPFRAVDAEQQLAGSDLNDEVITRAAEAAAQSACPITDIRSTVRYRTEMVKVLVRRTLVELREEVGT